MLHIDYISLGLSADPSSSSSILSACLSCNHAP